MNYPEVSAETVFRNILLRMSAAFYVSDFENDTLLFINDKAKEILKLTGDPTGKPCWRMLMGKTERCSYCPKRNIEPVISDQLLVWEVYIPQINIYVRNTGQVIQWIDGQTVYSQMSVDITNLIQKETIIKERLKQQEFMSDIARRFVKMNNIGNTFTEVLKMICGFLGGNTAYIYRYNREKDHFERMHYWVDPGIDEGKFTADIVSGSFARKYIIHDGKEIIIEDDNEIPSGEVSEDSFRVSHIVSPLFLREGLWGFAGVSCLYKTRKWTEGDKNLLRLFTGIIDTAIGRELAEIKLSKSERTLGAVINGLTQAVYWKDANTGIYEGCNNAFLSLTGKHCEEVVGRTDPQLFDMVFADMHRSWDQETLQLKDPAVFFEHYATSSGEKHIIKIVKTVIRGDDGRAVRIIGNAEDITESVMMEMKIRDALARQEMVMQNYHGSIISIGEDRIINFFGGYSIYGIEKEKALGRSILDVYQDFPQIIEVIEKAFAFGPQNIEIDINGIIVHYQINPIFDHKQSRNGVLLVGRDITEQYLLKKKLEQAIVAAREASRAKSDFLSRMSHEIRTPMNAIIGMTKIGMDSDNLARKQYCLEKIDVASTNLLELINQILDMSKIEANKFELTHDEFDFEKMLGDICIVMSIKIEEKSQKFSINFENDIPCLYEGDEVRISQIITNLISNAVKFTPENGTIALKIRELESTKGYSLLQISVSDNGIGITPDQQNHIFNSFEQADGGTSRKYGGTGLGLAICKKLVHMMGGEIRVESEYGKGSTFLFTLRLKKSKKEPLQDKLRPLMARSKLNILVIDDDPEIRNYLVHIMEGFGISYALASGGEEGIDQAMKNFEEAKPFDIIFLDWKMPGMDGLGAASIIKTFNRCDTIVIMCSSMEWAAIQEEAGKMGISRFIPKPLFPSSVYNIINEIVFAGTESAGETGRPVRNLAGKTILLTEDVEINREIVMAMLEDTGVTLDVAENGKQALELIQEHPGRYNMILMDVQMPEMDGYEAASMIRSINSDYAKAVPILAMTANVFQEDVRNCLDAGMNDHISKPVDLNDLQSKIEKYIL